MTEPAADLPLDDARTLIRAIVDLVHMADRALPRQQSALVGRLREHLGVDDGEHSIPNTATSLEMIELVNLQLAFDALAGDPSSAEIFGVSPELGNYGGVSLATIVDGGFRGPVDAARQHVSVELGDGETVKCLRAGVILTVFDGGPVAALMYPSERRRLELVLEIVADTQERADAFLGEVRRLMAANNVMRGRVLTFGFSEYGGFGLTFTSIPHVARHEVVLPAAQLDAIEEHALGITAVGAELRAAGQHLKRGLLLYGPPGTGKTHTVSYLVTAMRDRTTIVLSGASVEAVGQAGTIARKLAPATVVIEDVDLIGMDRGLPGGEHNPLLFQLLNEMDGLHDDDDVLFVLTTNRADLLEPALAARPGRVDQAIEIGLPDADGRRALFELYLGQPVDEATMTTVVDASEGVAAAFVKELCRRAVLDSLRTGAVIDDALRSAVDHLRETATPMLRAALAGGPATPRGGWTAFPPGS